MARFSIKDLLNDSSKPGGREEFKVELISVRRLVASEDNFYSVEDVADLKDSIEMMGVQQNLTVEPIPGTDQYKVIAGHRRRLATLKLMEEGKAQFELVPCRIETSEDDIKKRIMLIHTNATTRELSDWEKIEQMNQLKELIAEYKKDHELPGRVRELLAETLNVSASQVGRMESISKNLSPDFKEELKQGNISASTAAELARKPEPEQRAAFEQHKEAGKIVLSDVKETKPKLSAERMAEIRSVLLNRNDRQYFTTEAVRRAGLDLLAELNRRIVKGE